MTASDRKFFFEEFVEVSVRVQSRDRLLELFTEAMAEVGYDRVNFSIRHDDDVPEKDQGFGIISTYPEEWQTVYRERDFSKIDPVARCASSTFRPFRWREVGRITELTKRQIAFLKLAEEAGLHNGIGVPFKGPRVQIAGVALATSSKSANHLIRLETIAAYCEHFYSMYKSLVGQPAPPPTMATLSEREQDILIRAAHGRSDAQIAEVLFISDDTVNFHLRNIYQKLGVNNRVAAVATALRLRLIE